MAGSVAINIYSESRVAGESTGLEPVSHSATPSLKSRAQTLWSAVTASFPSAPFSHPVQLQQRQTDWAQSLLFLTS